MDYHELIKLVNDAPPTDPGDLSPEFTAPFEAMAKGFAARSAGHWDEAITCLNQVAKFFDDMGFSIVAVAARQMVAECQANTGNHAAAIAGFAQIIGMSTDPTMLRQLAADKELFDDAMGPLSSLFEGVINIAAEVLIAKSYFEFVSSARQLQEIPIESLFEVLDDGVNFIRSVGHPEWEHAFLSERADLLGEQGRFEEALKAARKALVARLNDKDGIGYGADTLRRQIGDFLLDLEETDQALATFLQVLDQTSESAHRAGAHRGAAEAYLQLGSVGDALEHADYAVSDANDSGLVTSLISAFGIQAVALAKSGKFQEARSAAAAMWAQVRRRKSLTSCWVAFLRTAQVRAAETETDSVQTPYPPSFTARALACARALDLRGGTSFHGDKLRTLLVV